MDKTEIEIDGVTYHSKQVDGGDGDCRGCAFYTSPFGDGCEQANELQSCVPPGRWDQGWVIWVK